MSDQETSPRRMDLAAFHAECQAQGVPDRIHRAFRCPKCGTAQSIAVFMSETGLSAEQAGRAIGAVCIGAYASDIGCVWSAGLGAPLEVVDHQGAVHPFFALAAPEDAQRLAEIHKGVGERAA